MKTTASLLIILAGLAVSGPSVAAAPADSTNTTATQLYTLQSQSNYETGCFGPCLCAVRLEALAGTFGLTYVGFDGLYDNYAVSDVRWAASDSVATTTITGSGTYRIGGEVALLQELSLDLSINGDTPKHFDSGLVSGANLFPKIDIKIAASDPNTACVDTVIQVVAAPDPSSGTVTGAGSGYGSTRTSLGRVAPNPFVDRTQLQLSLAHAGPVDVLVYDVLGRTVRHVASGAWLPAGPHSISWDGRRDNGAACASGVYFVRARAGGQWYVRRVVKAE